MAKPCPHCGDQMSSPRRVQCGKPECERLHRNARMNAYNRAYKAEHGQWPSRRYPVYKRQVTCLACGRTYLSDNRRAKYCNKTCWAKQNTARITPKQKNGLWPSCHVPDWHPSRSTVVPASHPSRLPAPTPVFYGNCRDCDAVFVSRSPARRICSDRCARRIGKRIRRAREFNAGGQFTWTQVMRLFMAFDKRCAYCLKPVEGQPDPDHVVPLSRGGHNAISNILPACRACNCDKQNLTLEEWAAERVRLGKPAVTTSWDLSDVRYTHLALRPALPRPLAA